MPHYYRGASRGHWVQSRLSLRRPLQCRPGHDCENGSEATSRFASAQLKDEDGKHLNQPRRNVLKTCESVQSTHG